MKPRAALLTATLFSLSVSAFAVDPAFKLLKEDDKVNVYSRGSDCREGGADVLFVVENKTRERLELKMELLNLKIKNRLTVVVEPSSNTSVLSLSPDAAMCDVELVNMTVKSMNPPAKETLPAPVTASTDPEPKI